MLKFGNDNYRGHVEAVSHHFYISDVIRDPDDYISLIDCLYQGKPGENVHIHLNTQGGDLSITMQIINAIRNSDSTVIGVADGVVASAGSLILFACPNIAVQAFSYVMLHDGSEGALGKINENLRQAQFSAKLLKQLYHDIYSGFFTQKEIDSVLEGKDMWLTSEEVTKRVKKLIEKERDAEGEI